MYTARWMASFSILWYYYHKIDSNTDGPASDLLLAACIGLIFKCCQTTAVYIHTFCKIGLARIHSKMKKSSAII